jgi:hypothetical protein
MDALSAEQRARRRALLDRLRPQAQALQETPDGYALRLPADPGVVSEAAEFAALERRCCPFFRFILEMEAEGGPAWLRITGPEGAKDFLREALAAPTGSPD